MIWAQINIYPKPHLKMANSYYGIILMIFWYRKTGKCFLEYTTSQNYNLNVISISVVPILSYQYLLCILSLGHIYWFIKIINYKQVPLNDNTGSYSAIFTSSGISYKSRISLTPFLLYPIWPIVHKADLFYS